MGFNLKERIMTLNILKLQFLRGSIGRRVFHRLILLATAMTIFPFMLLMRANRPLFFAMNSDGCTQDLGFLIPFSGYGFSFLPSNFKCEENENLTLNLFTELMDKKLLKSDGKALCVGEGSASAVSALLQLGFADALMVKEHSIPLFKRRNIVHGLDFDENSFDFVFSRAPRVSISALYVLEIERIIKPGGIGEILIVLPYLNPGNLMKSVAPISSFLKSSDIVLVSTVDSFSMVVFQKKIVNVNPFEHYKLPEECSSVKTNELVIENLEPLLKKESIGAKRNFSYLPNLLNVSSRKRFIYIDIGAGQFLDSNITTRFFDSYPIQSRAFDIYVVDHDTSVLSSYVNKPRITFVYHPGLDPNINTLSFDEADDWPPLSIDGGFDFIAWFKETVEEGDFVILKMNAAEVELKILHELFESEAICLVDELFLRCAETKDDKGGKSAGNCVDLFQGLRSSGVFVHQWM